jgi:hypothetical protein
MDGHKSSRRLILLPLVLLACSEANAGQPSTRTLIAQLADAKQAPIAAGRLIKSGPAVIPQLGKVVTRHDSLVARGWAIVAIGRIGGPRAKSTLDAYASNNDLPELVRSWSAAARIESSDNIPELQALSARVRSQPALQKPWNKQVMKVLKESGALDGGNVENLILMASSSPQLTPALASAITKLPTKALAKVMFKSKNNQARRMAASYLGTKANQVGINKVAPQLARLYRYKSPGRRGEVFWKGGGLFVPGIQWPQPQARRLMSSLIQWLRYTEGQGLKGESRQLMNNLRSVSLHRAAGVRPGGHNPQAYFRLLEQL